MNRFHQNGGRALIACILIGVTPIWAAEPAAAAADPASTTSSSTATSNVSEMEQLKRMLIEQQRQIDELKRLVMQQNAQQNAQQQRDQAGRGTVATSQPAGEPSNPFSGLASGQAATPTSEAPASNFPALGQVASTTAVIPRSTALPALPEPLPQASSAPASSSSNPCDAPPDGNAVPTYLRLGSVCIQPIGFMDLTAVWRDKAAGSGIGSSFGSVPYNNAATAKNSEFHFSPQNSRIGFRIDGDWKGTHFIGYNEFDFLGTSGSSSLAVTNGAFVPRIRLYWVDARKGKVEFLAGQSWSMFTPNRVGISALPGDLFYSQVMDVNYMAGLTWTRQPGMRVLYHPTDKITFGFSAENPNQYIGGSAGGGSITFPSALTALGGTQFDNAANISTAAGVLAEPQVAPDFIAKMAIDPSSRFHFEVGGIQRTFKDWNPNTGSALGAGQYSTAIGGGVLVGANAEIFKGFRLITTNSWGDGIGRYLFGQAPDLMIRSNGSISPMHSGGTVDGFEATVGNFLIFGYYGGIYIARDVALDANGTSLIGYGYTGSANSQNRSIQEITFGYNETIWRSPRYGAINLIGQYEYLLREPWFSTATQAGGTQTHDSTIYFDVRYTLPGANPKF
jgi:hypothetical protein